MGGTGEAMTNLLIVFIGAVIMWRIVNDDDDDDLDFPRGRTT